tara:strand:+ start:508 stop:726 length:219 start_codon:yes stop_codon:yes gene_type:complete
MKKNIAFTILILFNSLVLSDEIIKDNSGNFFLIKKDGTYQKLPPPKPGNKYVIIKKKIKNNEKKKKIFSKTH